MEFYGIVWFWGVYGHLFGVTWGVGAQVGAKRDVLLVVKGNKQENHRGHRGAQRIDILATLCTPVSSVVQLSCLDVAKYDTPKSDLIKEIVKRKSVTFRSAERFQLTDIKFRN